MHPKFARPESPQPVSAAALRAWLASGDELALFDVRETGEAHRGHIFGATFLPRRRIELRIAELVHDRSTPIVVYDDGPGDARAARAAATLRRLGYTSVTRLDGGVAAWLADGQVLTEGANVPSKLFGEQVWEREHVPQVSVQQLHAWQQEGRPALVCDIRSPEEHARSRIPGARGAFGVDLALLAPDLRQHAGPVVLHCSGRTRGLIACQSLRELGVEHAFALENGTMGWRLAGLELERGPSEPALEPSASSAAEGEQAARTLGVQSGASAIEAETLASWLEQREAGHGNLYVIDVRQLGAYLEGHVRGAIAVPGGLAIQRTDEFVPVRAAPVVLVDDLEARAWLTACWLRRMGLPRVHVLAGGMLEWQRQRRPVQAGRGRQAPLGLEQARQQVRLLTPAALAAELRAGTVQVLQVDTSRHFATAHVPGACWVPYGQLEEWVQALPAGDQQRLVLSCKDGVLSTLAGGNLAALGLGAPAVLDGGVKAWQQAGLATSSGWDAAHGKPRDLLVQPYDGGLQSMARYLAWEQALTTDLGAKLHEPSEA